MSRQDIKKEWLLSKLAAKLTEKETIKKEEREKNESEYRRRITSLFITDNDRRDIAVRKEQLMTIAADELIEIFSMLWSVLTPYTENDILTEEGFTNFTTLTERALVDEKLSNAENVKVSSKADYQHYVTLFRRIDKEAFFQIMIDIIACWAEILNPRYYAAFAWALLSNLVDINCHPPMFKPLHQIKCMTCMDHESKVLMKFSTETQTRANVKLKNEWLSSSNMRPEVQKRLGLRKDAQRLTKNSVKALKDMIILQRRAAGKYQTGLDEIDDDDEDEEEESLEISPQPSQEAPIIPPSLPKEVKTPTIKKPASFEVVLATTHSVKSVESPATRSEAVSIKSQVFSPFGSIISDIIDKKPSGLHSSKSSRQTIAVSEPPDNLFDMSSFGNNNRNALLDDISIMTGEVSQNSNLLNKFQGIPAATMKVNHPLTTKIHRPKKIVYIQPSANQLSKIVFDSKCKEAQINNKGTQKLYTNTFSPDRKLARKLQENDGELSEPSLDFKNFNLFEEHVHDELAPKSNPRELKRLLSAHVHTISHPVIQTEPDEFSSNIITIKGIKKPEKKQNAENPVDILDSIDSFDSSKHDAQVPESEGNDKTNFFLTMCNSTEIHHSTPPLKPLAPSTLTSQDVIHKNFQTINFRRMNSTQPLTIDVSHKKPYDIPSIYIKSTRSQSAFELGQSSFYLLDEPQSIHWKANQPVPWVPDNGLHPMISDKRDKLTNWEERKFLKQFCSVDPTSSKAVIKRQHVIKHSFQHQMNYLKTQTSS